MHMFVYVMSLLIWRYGCMIHGCVYKGCCGCLPVCVCRMCICVMRVMCVVCDALCVICVYVCLSFVCVCSVLCMCLASVVYVV